MKKENGSNKPRIEFEELIKKLVAYWPIIGGLGAVLYGAYKFSTYLFVFVYLKSMGASWLLGNSGTNCFLTENFSVVTILVLVSIISLALLPIESNSEIHFKKYMKIKATVASSATLLLAIAFTCAGILKPGLFAKYYSEISVFMWTILSTIFCVLVFDLPFSLIKYGSVFSIKRINIAISYAIVCSLVVICQAAYIKGKDDLHIGSSSLPIVVLKSGDTTKTLGAVLIKDDLLYLTELDTISTQKLKFGSLFHRPIFKDAKINIVPRDSVKYVCEKPVRL